MSDRPTLYLAGPMTGLTWRQALGWRERVTSSLTPSWRIISPLREQMLGQDLDSKILPVEPKGEKIPILLTSSSLATQDEFYVHQSDFILANFTGAKRASIGTIWEMGVAWEAKKYIVSVVEPGSIHDHSFVRRRSHIFVPELDEAIEFFKGIVV